MGRGAVSALVSATEGDRFSTSEGYRFEHYGFVEKRGFQQEIAKRLAGRITSPPGLYSSFSSG